MPRPREPFADALRTAREIVEREGCALVAAGHGTDSRAVERAYEALILRIAQSIADAEAQAPDTFAQAS